MTDKKRKYFFLFLPLILGVVVSIIIMPFFDYNTIIKPSFAPSKIVFPIVWTILYLLLGYVYVRLFEERDGTRTEKILYFIGLFLNLAWPILFFVFRLFTFSSIWIVLLIFTIGYLIKKIIGKDKVSVIILLIYELWLLFAFVLNISIAKANLN